MSITSTLPNLERQDRIRHSRPCDRVREYLLAEFDRADFGKSCRLPPMRKLAAHLKVSVATVQGVFRELAREGRIQTKVGNGSFLAAHRPQTAEGLKLALNIATPSGASIGGWTCRIYGGILHAALHAAKPVTLLALPPQDTDGRTATQNRLESEIPRVDGLILFPYALSERVRSAYEEMGKPVVDLNPFSGTATSNFVSPDYFGGSVRLGNAWRETGRKRIGLMLHLPLEQSVSNQLRLAGLVNGLGSELGRSISCRIVVAVAGGREGEYKTIGEENGYKTIQEWRQSTDWPLDALYCIGDGLAVGAVRAVRELGVRIPEDVSVIGGSGMDLSNTACPGLTRTQHPLEQMGENLVTMLCERIAQNGSSLPGRILPTPFIGGDTTRREENEILGVHSNPVAPPMGVEAFHP